MRQLPRTVRAAAAGALVVALGSTAAPTAPASTSPSTAVPGPARSDLRTVTLVTGDRVEASPDLKKLRFVPGPGRKRMTFTVHRAAERVSVIPRDAFGPLNRRQLDPRLFELNELLKYDDERRQDLPLIVAGAPRTRNAAVGAAGGTESKTLTTVGSIATRVPKDRLTGFYGSLTRDTGITKIWLDGIRKPLLDKSAPQIGAPTVWADGFTGKGVKVGVLDGGVDADHPDLKGRVTSADFTGTDPGDVDGHGTHVASIVAGTGAAAANRYRGVAPDAELLSGKVCELDGCPESAILAGIDWAVQQDAKIVNLSLGGWDSPGIDLIEQSVNTHSAEHGTLFVIAAGNSGPSLGSVSSPGSAAAALTVGAVDPQDQLADFSSRGPTADAGPVKPDVTAPGVGIVAAKSATSTIGEPVGTSYLRLSGTSMSTPHVAGAAALLAQAHPDWSGAQLKSALVGSAKVLPNIPVTHQGAGRVDVAAAADLPVLADSAALGFKEQRWPHTDDQPEARDVTYTNHSDAPVELDLAASFTAPDGKPAPVGAVRLSTSSLTVPVKGSAKVTVTSDTTHSGPDGDYAGRLTATVKGAALTLTSTLAVRREAESYDLTIKFLDRNGLPTNPEVAKLFDRDPTEGRDNSFEIGAINGGVATLRLPKGRYLLESLVNHDKGGTLLVRPKLDLTSDQTVTMDSREAKPIRVTVPDSRAVNHQAAVAFELNTDLTNSGMTLVGTGATEFFTGQVGPTVPRLTSTIQSEWSVPSAEGERIDSPVVYQLNYSKLDGMHDGFTKKVRHDELTTLRPTLSAEADGTVATWEAFRSAPYLNNQFNPLYAYKKLPAKPTVYLTQESQLDWLPKVRYWTESNFTTFDGTKVTCRVGRTCADTWGQAVFGPKLTTPATTRTADTLVLHARGTDGRNRLARMENETGRFVVRKDGVELGTVDNSRDEYHPATLTVPAGPGDYQVDYTASAGAMSLSTKTSTSWKFKSDTTTSQTALPLWVAAFQPPVDDHNTVQAGKKHVLPLRLDAQAGAQVGKLSAVKLWTSADDGKTWQEAPVTGSGNQKRAVVTTPPGAGFLNLRLEASDSAGNSVKQEILRAYKYAG